MKKIFYLIFVFNNFLLSQIQPYEWINPSPAPYLLYDVFFLDSLKGWAVGDYSTAIKTIDGGKTWTHINIPIRATLHRVYFADEEHGWIVGGDPVAPSWGAILRTTNGGHSWSNYQPHPQYDYSFLDLSMPTKYTGYVAGFEGIFKTINGGEDWFNTGGTTWATSVFFIDSLTGWGTNPIGKILKTTDGANTWNSIYEFHWKFHKRIRFFNEHIGWLVSKGLYDNYGTIYKTTDGGFNWVLQDSIVNIGYYDVEIIDTLNVIAVGDNGFIKYTTDGGNMWYNSSTNNWDTYYGISVKDNSAWLVGGNYNHPVMFKSKVNNLDWKIQTKVFTNSDLTAIDFANKNTGWLGGFNGSLFCSSDGGNNWIPKELFNIDFGSISTPNLENVFIGGNTGALVKSTDAGETWTLNTIRPMSYFGYNHQIKFFSESIGLSFTKYGALLKTTTGGTTWNTILDFADDFFFIDSLNGWIFYNLITREDYAHIRKTTDGGLSWSDEVFINSAINTIFFIDERTGWYSDGYSIYKTMDGGFSWSLINNYIGYYVRQLIFLDDNEGFILGSDDWGYSLGNILKTTDGGITFNPLKKFTFLNYIKINDKNIFGVGSYGQLIKIDRTFTDVKEEPFNIPEQNSLFQNYPNPFNPNTKIQFIIPKLSTVTLKVYDVLGREVTTLVSEEKSPGVYEVVFDASQLSSGIYFYKLQTDNYTSIKKMIYLK